MPKSHVANLEEGMPTGQQALLRLDYELHNARRAGAELVKIIHGYGSSGRGGALRDIIQKDLRRRVEEGRLSGFIAGEDFRVANESAWMLLKRFPGLKRDRDWCRGNRGISIVVL